MQRISPDQLSLLCEPELLAGVKDKGINLLNGNVEIISSLYS
jgi:hypothetical protein